MRQVIKNVVKQSRKTNFFWQYFFNFLPTIKYQLKTHNCSPQIVSSIVESLNRDGIAITTIDEFLPTGTLFNDLEIETKKLLAARRNEFKKLKRQAGKETEIGKKTYNVELLGSEIEFDPESIFACLALQEAFLNVANDYFGMLVKLRYYNVWLTFATDSKPRESQLWHFDREDKYILKVFLYLNDVDEGAGPFVYAPKTHQKGILRNKEPEHFLENNICRTTDEQMNEVMPNENWIKATGRKGTLIFADTRGYHKGGEARTSNRLMFTCMFTSPASESKRLLNFPNKLKTWLLNKKQLAALELS